MADIRIDDLPQLDDLSADEQQDITAAGGRKLTRSHRLRLRPSKAGALKSLRLRRRLPGGRGGQFVTDNATAGVRG
jgi:hypothetical protein